LNDKLVNLSLVEDNWWCRPDFLSFSQGLMETAKEELKLPLDEMERHLRVPLTEEMGNETMSLGDRIFFVPAWPDPFIRLA